MYAVTADFLKLLGADSTQFVIPVYQRVYSWDKKECRDLWKDVMRAGRDGQAHFIGSFLYTPESASTATSLKRNLLIDGQQRMTTLSLGKVPSGLASVKVNGVDCGIVWCTPWTAEVKGALRAGANEIEIRYVNNWYNRLLGDCFLPPEKRVTKSVLRYWTEPRKGDPARPWAILPTIYSGYSVSDPLQPSGLVGPVELR